MSIDTNYWNEFYNKKQLELIPSDFCLYVMDYLKSTNNEKIKILDAGCGNGRDSYHLSKKYLVDGMDISYKPDDTELCKFKQDDFTTCDKTNYDMIYSRFTFHSITNEQQETFIKSIHPGTLLCIETRSDKGKNDNRYYGDDHYRNFTNVKYLKKILDTNGFEILYIEENNDFAVYNDENPICIRVICNKV
jgi:tellurite methyltransferase